MCGQKAVHDSASCRCRLYSFLFRFCFLQCRYLISSLILITVALCFVCTCAGEVLGTLILAYVGVSFLARHCLLK